MNEITIKNQTFKIEASAYTLVIYQKLTRRSMMADFASMEKVSRKMKETGDIDFASIDFMMFLDILFCLQNPLNTDLTYEAFLKSLPLEFAFSKELFDEVGKIIKKNFSLEKTPKEINENSEKNYQGIM